MVKIVEYYEVYYDFDGVYGIPSVNARFSELYVALDYAANIPSLCVDTVKKKMVIYDSVYEIEQANKQEVRDAALAKLTNTERLALGV